MGVAGSARRDEGPVSLPDAVQYWGSTPLRPIGWLWWLLLPALFPRRREAWALGLVALVLRAVLDPDRILMARDYAPQRLRSAWDVVSPHYLYGDGWTAVHAPIWRLLGQPAEVARTTNLLLSALTPVLLWAWLERRGEPPWLRRVAAGLLVALPLAVAMAGTEDHFVTVALLQVAALAGLEAPSRLGRLAGALSVGLLPHTRPDEAPVAALVLAVAVARRRWDFVAVGGALVAWRAVEVLAAFDDGIAQSWQGDPNGWGLDHLVGRGSGLAILDPDRVPLAVALLAAVGVVTARDRATTWLALGLALVTGVPFMGYHALTDIVRFQLPALSWWCVLAALGAGWVVDGSRARAVAVAAFVVGTGWLARAPLGPLPHWAMEHRLVEAAARVLPRGAVVRYDPVWDRNGAFREVAGAITGARWVPLGDGPVAAGEWLWSGRAALYPDHAPAPACTLARAVLEVAAPVDPAFDYLEPATAPAVRIALERVVSCP